MKKCRILSIILLLLVSLSFVGCRKKPTTTKEQVTTTSNERTVEFDSMGGSLVESATVKIGSTVNEPANPTKEYFTFIGWYLDSEYNTACTFPLTVNDSFTVYAKWAPYQAQVISFNTNGGSAVSSIYGTEGDTIVLPENPTKEGFEFSGWYTDAELQNGFNKTKYTAEADYTLYAKWTQLSGYLTIYYHVADDVYEKSLNTGKVTLNNSLLPLGTVLDGWYKEETLVNKVNEGDDLTESIDLYASFYTEGLVFNNNKVTAYNGEYEDVYLPTKYNGTVIDTIESYTFYDNKVITNVYIPETLVNINSYAFYNAEYLRVCKLSQSTALIDDYAFYGCKRLREIETLGNVTTIGESAFSQCEELRNFNVSANLTEVKAYAFSDCSYLTSIELPSALTTIGAYAFSDCSSLEVLNLPSNLITLGDGALKGVNNVTVDSANTNFVIENDTLMNSNKSVIIKYFGSAQSYTFNNAVTEIKAYAFEGNTSIAELDLSNVNNVNKSALYMMKGLNKLTLKDLSNPVAYYFGAENPADNGSSNQLVSPALSEVSFTNGATVVGSYAFYGINNLSKVTGLENVTTIAEYAFAYTGFTSFEISSSLTSIDSTAFFNSKSLKEFTCTSSTKYSVINKCLYSANGTELILVPTSIESFEFGPSITTIKQNAFNGVNIESIVIPETITVLEKGCLTGAVNLQSLTLPGIGDNGANKYMQYLFGSTMTIEEEEVDGETVSRVKFDTVDGISSSLKEINLTTTIVDVPDYAFMYFDSVENINFMPGLKTIGKYAFARTGIINLEVPETVVSIGDFAYAYCYQLSEANVYANTIGEGIFTYDLRLKEVTFNEGLEAISEYCFYPYRETNVTTGQTSSTTKYYSSLEIVRIPSTVTAIEKAAFLYAGIYGDDNNNCVIVFAENSKLERIGVAAFEYAGIKKYELPSSVRVLEEQAFGYCKDLEEIRFGNGTEGSNLEEIGNLAFVYTSNLHSFYCYKVIETEEDLPKLSLFVSGGAAFYPFEGTCENFTLYVPENAINLYKTNQDYRGAGLKDVVAIKD